MSKFSVKKPYTVLVAVIMVIVLGVVSFMKMSADLLPSINLPYVIVMTTYVGASPETVEMVVTKPVESAMATISNIENITYFEEINKVREKMFPKRTNEYYPGLAKAYSQLGQVLSYLRDASAEDYFKESLKGYEAGSANYNITLSFLMHFYIEMGEEYKEKFIQASIEYFQGNKELEKQFAYLVKEGAKGREALISLKFALFVFLKGIYRFRLKDISKKLKTKLLDIEQAMKEIDVLSLNEMNGHPWELIYKYLAFIMLELGNISVAETYMKKSREVLKEKGFTIERLIQFGELEYQMKCGKTAIQETEDYQELEKIITYMYR